MPQPIARPTVVLGVEPRITLPIARSLDGKGVPVDVISLAVTDPHLRSRAVRRFERLPGENSAQQAEALCDRIAERGYDMLIPATDAALTFLCEHEARLRELLYVACPRAEVVQRVLDKSATLEIARNAGIKVPETYRLRDIADLEASAQKLSFPVVAKPFHKSYEVDFKVRYFPSYEALHAAFVRDPQLAGRILVQEYAPGEGVGVELLIRGGEPLAMFQHRRLKEVPSTGGAAAVAIGESVNPSLAEQAVKLLRALEWDGVAMVEFRYDKSSGRSALMEVNGRYWGTLALPIQAGIDFPWYGWQLAHGQTPSPPTSYSAGLRWRWTAGYLRRWHGMAPGVLRRALKRPGAVVELLPSAGDLGLSTRDALWSWSDPMPALVEPARQIGHLLAADFRAVVRRVFRRRASAAAKLAQTSPQRSSDGHE